MWHFTKINIKIPLQRDLFYFLIQSDYISEPAVFIEKYRVIKKV